jgi:hypothetical protein
LPALLGNAADDGVADPPGTGPIAERG